MQGFRHIFNMPDEVAQIIAHCEECLIKAKIITTEIQGGILKKYLIDDDYLAPQKVNFADHHYSSRTNCHYFRTLFLLMDSVGHNNPSYLLHITFSYTFSEKSNWRPGVWHFKKPLNNKHIQRLKRKKVKTYSYI